MNAPTICATLLLPSLLLCSCGPTRIWSTDSEAIDLRNTRVFSADYFTQRGRDLRDVPILILGLGMGVEADIGVTSFIHVGLGVSGGPAIGAHHGAMGQMFEKLAGFPFSNFEASGEPGGILAFFYQAHDDNEDSFSYCPRLLWVPLDIPDEEESLGWAGNLPRPLHWYDLQVGVSCAPVLFRAGISLGELSDFFLGWFNFDIGNDDM